MSENQATWWPHFYINTCRMCSSTIAPSAITFEQGTKISRIKPYITSKGQVEK